MKGKKIVLGITGSIAAYKACSLIRLFIKAGAEVQVVITPAGKEFITPVTLSTLTSKPVVSDFFSRRDGSWHSHVDLGLWADAMVIAPCTASTLGKMAHGIADNMLITTYLSMKAPVFIAPAMDLDMYRHPATQANLQTLRQYGNHIIGHDLTGKRVLITAGPTYEKIDAVRFIGNFSTGKMGFALAEACAARGAEIELIAGPVAMQTHHPHIKRTDVTSAQQMYEAATSIFPHCDTGILCAAVADFTVAETAEHKIKREGSGGLHLDLIPTHDIARALGAIKRDDQKLVGFALETDHELEHATDKLKRKNLDFIVLNSLRTPGAGFACDTNKVTLLFADGTQKDFPLKSKAEVADDIVDFI